MARFSASVLAIAALALVAPSHQQYYFPAPYPAAYNQRLFLGGQLLPNFLVRTTTSTTTSTITATCTRLANACGAAAEQPFPNGIARSLPAEDDEQIIPSKIESVEPTAVPEKRQAFYYPGYYQPYGAELIDSSFVQGSSYYPNGAYPPYPGAAQARLFVTRTLTTTTFSTTTRSLQPVCSRPGYFTQCS